MSQASHLRAIEPTLTSHISIDSNGGVRSSRFDDIYFSPGQGVAETQHVFIEGNLLQQRWQQLAAKKPSSNTDYFCIGELGFGTGLNFLVAAEQWLECFAGDNPDKATTPTLYFFSTEKYPLTRAAMRKVYEASNVNLTLQEQLLAKYPDPIGSDYCLQFRHDNCQVVLVLLFGDSVEGLSRLEHYPPCEGDEQGHRYAQDIISNAQDIKSNAQGLTIDAWFLDGFAPSKNEHMWSASLCQQMAARSAEETTVATFTVARAVRDALAGAGFTVEKKPGFGNKRNMLCATYASARTVVKAPVDEQAKIPKQEAARKQQRQAYSHNNCFYRGRQSLPGTVAVIGAGIAGCCTARQLADAGFNVQVYDSNAQVAGGASGNPRAVLFARTAAERSTLSDLHEAGYHYALGFYQSLSSEKNNLTTALCGMSKLGEELPAALQHGELASRQQLSKTELSKQAGIAVREGGVFYPHSGYVEPASLCNALLDHPAISLALNTPVTALERRGEVWKLTTEKNSVQPFSSIVLCCGYKAVEQPSTGWLPIKPIRGQTTALVETADSQQLTITLCDKGYVTPGQGGLHESGATFNLNSHNTELSHEDHQTNLDNVNASFAQESPGKPQLFNDDSIHSGRVGFRATSPDYLPMAGPVVEPEVFFEQYRSLSSNAKRTPSSHSQLIDGLYVNTAYGSQGFTLAPLVSLLVTTYISGQPFPIGEQLRQAVSPSRFLLRALIRNKTDQYL